MNKHGLLGRRSATASRNTVRAGNVVAATDLGNGEAELILYGDIVENEPINWWTGEPTGEMCISLERILDEVEKLKGFSHITLRLNSGGGSLWSGLAIHTALRKLGAKVSVIVDGLAASAASIVACAADELIVYPWSIFMVHRCMLWLGGYYNAADLNLILGEIAANDQAMINIYVARTGRAEDEIKAELDAETWLTGQEIVDAGYADMVDAEAAAHQSGTAPQLDPETHTLVVAGCAHDVSAYKNAKMALKERPTAPTNHGASAHNNGVPQGEAGTEGDPMDTVEELQAAYPDLVSQLQQTAAAAERDRIRSIDAIEASVGAELAARAKYEEPMSAADLALRAMQADANRGADHLQAMADDADESNTDAIEAIKPQDSVEVEADSTKELLAAAAELVNQMNEGKVR